MQKASSKGYLGTHNGVIQGKDLQTLGNPNKKAQRKLAARIKTFETESQQFSGDKRFNARQRPGSLNVRNH